MGDQHQLLKNLRLQDLRVLLRKPMSKWMLSRGKTRILQMRSETCWINLVMEEDQSMILTNKEGDLKLKKKNCSQLLRRLKVHLSQKRTRSLELSLSCLN